MDTRSPCSGRQPVVAPQYTVAILRAHSSRQLAYRDKWQAITRCGSTPAASSPARTATRSVQAAPPTRFRKLTTRAALPLVRLHDLRHGAASLAHEAGADLKTLQDLLGHASIVVTADTYTSVLPDLQRRCADATAGLVLAAARHTRKRIKEKAARNRPVGRDENKHLRRNGTPPRSAAAGHAPAATRSVTESDDTQLTPTVHKGRTARRARPAFPQFRPV